ncbi:tetratricopeptide repeat protein [Chloroflexi bacterium TSY]|nr:tetratricopeptide repeat protein [Chloroflexi bacterium TSY]
MNLAAKKNQKTSPLILENNVDIPQNRTVLFHHYILRGLNYWRNHDAVQAIDVSVLDHKRESILKTLSLGIDLADAWQTVRPLMIAFASYMERRGHWDAWHSLLLRAIAVAQRVGDLDGEVTLTALLARVCQRQSRTQETVQHYRRVIRLARQTGNQFEEARACSNLGYLYIEEKHWWRSEVLSRQALEIFQAMHNDHGLMHTHNHLGVLAHE